VEIDTDNSDGKLIPYLTANVKFLVAERKDVLLVPNAALRWAPVPNQVAPELRRQPQKSKGGKSGKMKAQGSEGQENSPQGTLWIVKGSYVQPVKVSLGPSDGALTEVQGSGLREGMAVVVAEQQKGNDVAGTASPFTPKLFRGGK
jgi:HlyD family secretion protein